MDQFIRFGTTTISKSGYGLSVDGELKLVVPRIGE